jgi:hypothetical protein
MDIEVTAEWSPDADHGAAGLKGRGRVSVLSGKWILLANVIL